MWKSHKLVLLPVEEKTSIIKNTYINKKHNQSSLIYLHDDHVLKLNNVENVEERGYKFQHLYLISDEDIKVRDKLAYDKLENKIADYRNENASLISIIGRKYSKDYLVPIIASTDSKLNLPTFSEDFLREYCKLDGAKEVTVEYKKIAGDGTLAHIFIEDEHELKLNSNTIITQPIKTNWDRDELEYLLEVAWLESQKLAHKKEGAITFFEFMENI